MARVERDRSQLRGAALHIIRTIVEKPDFDKMRGKEVRRDWLAPPPLSAFQRLEPLGFGLAEEDWWVFNPKECSPELVWPLDVSFVSEHCAMTDGMAMTRAYTVSMKQVRGYASRVSPFIIRLDHAQMDRGQLLRAALLRVWLGGEWRNAVSRTVWDKSEIPHRLDGLDTGDEILPRLATAIALRQRYEWAVSLGLQNSPSVRFATDPTGIKDIFRIRDLPDGKDRRDALMTWVTDHWRQDRNDPDLELYVRKHLRGATQFTWRGMNCELLPAKFDLDQRDRFLAERQEMRLMKTDKRSVA